MPRYVDAEKIRPFKGLFDMDFNVPKFYDWVETLPPEDVVDKELYDRLLKNSILISEALDKYRIAGAAEVVQCKDCEHYKQSEADPNRKMCCRKDVDGFSVCYDFHPTDYCSYGERRGNE